MVCTDLYGSDRDLGKSVFVYVKEKLRRQYLYADRMGKGEVI